MAKAKGSLKYRTERWIIMAAPDVYRIADNQIMDEIQLAKYIAKNDEKVAQK